MNAYEISCCVLVDITDSSRNTQLTREQIRSSLQGIVVELTAVEQLPAAVEVRWKVSHSHLSLDQKWIMSFKEGLALMKVKQCQWNLRSYIKIADIVIFIDTHRLSCSTVSFLKQ